MTLVINDLGRTSADPCDGDCGPLELTNWYATAHKEISRLDGLPGIGPAVVAGLGKRWERLPPRLTWPFLDTDKAVADAAKIAQDARDLHDQAAKLPTGGTKTPGGTKLPPGTIPDLPKIPGTIPGTGMNPGDGGGGLPPKQVQGYWGSPVMWSILIGSTAATALVFAATRPRKGRR